MEMKKSYRFLRGTLKLFSRRMKVEWEVPYDGQPSVFCPNHDRAWGPIDMCVHFDLRDTCHPWYNAAVADRKTVPEYVRNDFWWEPGCRMEKFYSATIPYAAAAILPPVLKCVPGVPVHHDMNVLKTFRQSASILKDGENIVIFAEKPVGYRQSATELQDGFLQIAPMIWRSSGVALNFYPVRVDHKKKIIRVFKPVAFDPERTLPEQKQEIIEYLGRHVIG